MLSRVRIVLVSPSGAGNVGAVCRAMANMGLSDLAIVEPRCDLQDEMALAFASHARYLLERARVVNDIPTALAGCIRSYVTSSKLGLYRRQVAITAAEAATEITHVATRGHVALVFGREDYGLRTRELLHFDRIVSIPADDAYPVMNLAASTAVLCYELRQAWLRHTGQPELPLAIDPGIATHERKEILFEKLYDALERVGFLYGPNPDHLKYALRHLLGRIDLSLNEADILIGLARQIRWYVDHHPDPKPPAK